MAQMVIDASLTLAWSIDSEITPERQRLLEDVEQHGAVVPSIWPLEVANGLMAAARSGRISEASVTKTLTELESLPVEIDRQAGHYAWRTTVHLGFRHHLTAYDAAYLELALRMAEPLATLDVRLARAARAEGLSILGAQLITA